MSGIIIDTPEGIQTYRILSLRKCLELEIKGFKRRGQSAYSIIKQEFGFKGNKKKVLEQFSKYIEEKYGA